MAIENGTNSYMPPQTLSLFENEISPLMGFLGGANDYVLYNNPKPTEFIQFWKNINYTLPQFISNSELALSKISRIEPWGWSQLINKLFPNGLISFKQFNTHDENKYFFSRMTSVSLINKLAKMPLPGNVSIPFLPRIITSCEEITSLLKEYSAGLVIKNLWSSSGRGILFIRNEKAYIQNQQWIVAQLKKQKQLIIEPIYNKIQDASMQFIINDDQTYTFLGINYFDSDKEGHFEKEYFHVPAKIQDQLPRDTQWIQQLANQLILAMQEQNIQNAYTGAIGIDVMFISDKNNKIKLYPLVEANLRCNMGLINLHIKQMLSNKAKGFWKISTFTPGEAVKFYSQQREQHPIKLESNKIKQGFIPLTPFHRNTRFAAWGLIQADY